MRFFGFEKKKAYSSKGKAETGIDLPKRGSYIGLESPKAKDPKLAAEARRLNSEGMERYHEQDFEEARAKFEDAVRIDPEYAEPYHHLFALYQKQGELGKGLLAAAKFVQLADPAHPALPVIKLMVESLGPLANGTEDLKVPENPGQLCLKAIGHAKAKRYDKALALFKRAVELDPDYGAGWSDMGRCLVEMGKASEAIDALLKASRLAPGDVINWAVLAQAYVMVNNENAAQECIEKCAQLGASDEFMTQARARCVMGHRKP